MKNNPWIYVLVAAVALTAGLSIYLNSRSTAPEDANPRTDAAVEEATSAPAVDGASSADNDNDGRPAADMDMPDAVSADAGTEDTGTESVDSVLPPNWDSLSVAEKIELNPHGCVDTTKIRADNGQCIETAVDESMVSEISRRNAELLSELSYGNIIQGTVGECNTVSVCSFAADGLLTYYASAGTEMSFTYDGAGRLIAVRSSGTPCIDCSSVLANSPELFIIRKYGYYNTDTSDIRYEYRYTDPSEIVDDTDSARVVIEYNRDGQERISSSYNRAAHLIWRQKSNDPVSNCGIRFATPVSLVGIPAPAARDMEITGRDCIQDHYVDLIGSHNNGNCKIVDITPSAGHPRFHSTSEEDLTIYASSLGVIGDCADVIDLSLTGLF